MKTNPWSLLLLFMILPMLAACNNVSSRTATPLPTPAVSEQAPKTTLFERGECKVTLKVPTPAYAASAIGGGQPSGEIPPGTYEAGVALQSGGSLWYGLNDLGMASFINSTSVAATTGNCAPSK